jgi:hypothetical protein
MVALAYHTFGRELAGRWNSLSREIEREERTYRRNERLLGAAGGIDSAYADAMRVAGSGNGASSAASTLQTVETIAGESVELHNVKPLEGGAVEHGVAYELEIDGRCSKENLIRFLYRLDTAEGAFRVRRLTITPDRDANFLQFYMVLSELRLTEVGPK